MVDLAAMHLTRRGLKTTRTFCCQVLGLIILVGCDEKPSPQTQVETQVEKLPDIQPNLPEVPTLPPPPYPLQYPNQSYSVYGLRKKQRVTMDKDLTVSGYIAEIYQPPECDKKKKEPCPQVAAPHMWIADSASEKDPSKRLTVVGYAENQSQLDKAKKKGAQALAKEAAETGMPPIPIDFEVGKHVVVKGKFTRLSSTGFNQSDGLLEYQGHETLPQ